MTDGNIPYEIIDEVDQYLSKYINGTSTVDTTKSQVVAAFKEIIDRFAGVVVPIFTFLSIQLIFPDPVTAAAWAAKPVPP